MSLSPREYIRHILDEIDISFLKFRIRIFPPFFGTLRKESICSKHRDYRRGFEEDV